MRKYIIGSIFGFILGITASVHAEEIASLIGSPVQGTFPVSVNGEKLSNDAIVVQDTSYLPVRAFGEATGYTVSFSDEREVILTKEEVKEVEAVTESEEIEEPAEIDEKEGPTEAERLQVKIGQIESKIDSLEGKIYSAKFAIEIAKQNGESTEVIAEREQTLADREAELAQREQELSELKSQLEDAQ